MAGKLIPGLPLWPEVRESGGGGGGGDGRRPGCAHPHPCALGPLPFAQSASALAPLRAHLPTDLPWRHCRNQWCNCLSFPGIRYVGNHLGALVLGPWAGLEGQLLEPLAGSFLTTLVQPAGGRRHPWNQPGPSFLGKGKGLLVVVGSPSEGRGSKGVLLGNLTPWLPRAAMDP